MSDDIEAVYARLRRAGLTLRFYGGGCKKFDAARPRPCAQPDFCAREF